MRERRHIPVRRALLTLIVAVFALATAPCAAHAGFSAELVDIVPEGNLFRYNYQLIFQTLPGRQRLDAGNGVLAPGMLGSQDFITIYDVGIPPEISGVTAGPGFTFQVQPVGVDAPGIIPLDIGVMLNVTYRYVGPPMTVSEETIFTGFSFLSPYNPQIYFIRVAQYSSQFTDSFGKEAGQKISILGPVEVPVSLIPEPSTWLLLMLGCLGVATLRRRLFGRRSGLVALVIALAVSGTRTSQAGFSAELVDIVPEGNLFRYNYQLLFSTLPGRQRLDAGNGVLAPGVVGSQDFITIYDVDHLAAISGVTAGPGFTFQAQRVGVDGPSVIPLDFGTSLNVTYRYVGPPITVSDETVFTGFSFLHPYGADPFFSPGRISEYTSQHTDNAGFDANRKISNIGPVVVPPTIPEPGTWLLLMLACVGVGGIYVRLSGYTDGG